MIAWRRTILAAAAVAVAMATAGAGTAGAADKPNNKDRAAMRGDVFVGKPLGLLAIEPVAGDLFTYMKVTTAGGCPRGTNTITRIYGPGFPTYGENIIGNSEVIEFGTPTLDRMTAPVTITIDEARLKQPPGTKLTGEYHILMNCQEPLPERAEHIYGVYTGKIRIDADGSYTALTSAKDLPKTPTPKAGNEALELAANPRANIDAEAASVVQAANPKPDPADTDSAALLAVSITGLILLGAGASVAIAKRRRTPDVATGGRRR